MVIYLKKEFLNEGVNSYMKVFDRLVSIDTTERLQEINIKEAVESVLFESKIKEGLLTVFTGHTTASVHLSNEDEDLERDFHDFLNDLIPNKPSYRHDKGDFGKNADAHFKSTIVGNSITVPVVNGKIVLGKWQTLYLSEFDGPRRREFYVKIIGLE